MRIIDLYNRFSQYKATKQFFIVFAIALIIRAISCIYLILIRGVLTSGDAANYIQFAQYILDQGIMVYNIEGLSAHAGPGYPLLIALNFLIAGNNSYWFILFINICCSAVAVPIFFLISKEILSKTWSLVFLVWYLLYVPQIWEVQFLGKESVVFGLLSICILAILRLSKQNQLSLKWILIFILCYSFLIHTDERYFFYLPFLLLYIIISKIKVSVKIKTVFLLVSLTIVCMLPWLYRNYIVFERPVILTERTAKFTDKLFNYDGPINKTRTIYFEPGTSEGNTYYSFAADSIKNGLSISDQRAQEKVIESIRKGIESGIYPKANTRMQEIWSYFNEFWLPVRFKSDFYGTGFIFMEKWNTDRWIFSLMQYGIFIPFFILGCILAIIKKQKVALFILSLVLIHCVIHVLLAHSITRYRLPIDPMIILLSFYYLNYLFYQINSKKLIIGATSN